MQIGTLCPPAHADREIQEKVPSARGGLETELGLRKARGTDAWGSSWPGGGGSCGERAQRGYAAFVT